jgi:iron complex outermembrane receptor protein
MLSSGNFQVPTWDRNFTQELQLLFDSESFNAVAGIYYANEKGRDGSYSLNIPNVSPNATITDGLATSKSIAAFGQATWRFAPRWAVTGGARYTREKKGLNSRNRRIALATGVITCNVPAALQSPSGSCSTDLEDTFKEPTWLLSLDYHPTEDSMVYAKFSRGFRSGGQNIRGSGLIEAFQPFEPEIATEYELGVKSDLLGHSMRLNAAVFYDELKDVQRSILILTPSNATSTVLTNAAKARLYGGEVEATWRVTSAFELSASSGYTNAKYKRFVDLTGDRSNEDWPAPKFQGSLGAVYTAETPWGGLATRVDLYHQSKLNLSPASRRKEEVTQKAFSIVNARTTLKIDAATTEVSLYVRNLFDKKTMGAAVNLESLGYNLFMPGDRRTYGVEVKKRFGGEAGL